jgi:hypothetical protein
MPSKRATHGCGKITINNIDYMIVIGGTDGYSIYSDILYYNIDKKLWGMTVQMPRQIADIIGVISMQLDSNGCNLMILSKYPGVNFINILCLHFSF